MTRPARVLWISCVGEKGGAEVYLLNFLRHLDRSRFVPVVALLREGPFEADLREAGIETLVLPRHRMRNAIAVAGSILRLRRIVRERGIDIVHGNGFRAHVYAGVAARASGRRAVWSVHTVEKPNIVTTAILRIPVASVTANCPRTANWFAARGLPVNMIWPPVEIAGLSVRTDRATLSERYQLPRECRWIGMASRLQRYKGHEFLLRALAALPAEFADVNAIIVGGALFGMEQDYLGQLRQLAAELGISGRVHFPGFVPDPDLHGLIAGCDVMVHPALDEDFGLIVAESLALERPVIAFATVGPSAIIEDGRSGYLVTIGDCEALTNALARTLRLSASERHAMGRAGRLRVERLFAAPIAARRLERVYESCLGGAALKLDALRQPILGEA